MYSNLQLGMLQFLKLAVPPRSMFNALSSPHRILQLYFPSSPPSSAYLSMYANDGSGSLLWTCQRVVFRKRIADVAEDSIC